MQFDGQSVRLVGDHVLGCGQGTFDTPPCRNTSANIDVVNTSNFRPLRQCFGFTSEIDHAILPCVTTVLLMRNPPQVELPTIAQALPALSTRVVSIVVLSVDLVQRTGSRTNCLVELFKRKSETFANFDAASSIVLVVATGRSQTSVFNVFPNFMFGRCALSFAHKISNHVVMEGGNISERALYCQCA